MRTAPFTADDLTRSVIAVPPLARHADLTLNGDENRKLIRHLESGGVCILLYGGNANFYNIALSEYAELLDFLAEAVDGDTLVIPSVGPAYGTMMDQAAILAEHRFPTVMILPAAFAATSAGIETGVRRFVEKFARPVVLYLKSDDAIEIEAVQRLFDDGLISIIKYAVVRDQPLMDDYLRELTDAVDPSRIMSGMGEQPTLVHLQDYRLGGFTSGCVCVAPRLSMDMLRALLDGQEDEAERIRMIFAPLEQLRNDISPIRVLHDAVTLAGIADTGPMLPLLSNLDEDDRDLVADAATRLLEAEQEARAQTAA